MFSLFAFIAFLCRDFLQVVLDKSQLLGSFRQRSAQKVQEVAIGSERHALSPEKILQLSLTVDDILNHAEVDNVSKEKSGHSCDPSIGQ